MTTISPAPDPDPAPDPVAADSFVSEITFDEPSHTYTLRGHTAPISVTGLISKHFEAFDGPAVVERYFGKWKENADSKYHALIHQHQNDDDAKRAILDGWEANKKEACLLGTAMHKLIEQRLIDTSWEQRHDLWESCDAWGLHGEIDAWEAWLDGRQNDDGWKWVASELIVGGLDADGKLCLGGSVDALFKNREGEYVLVDWKRTKETFGRNDATRFSKSGTGPAKALLDTKYNKYALQLAVYAELLRTTMGIDVGDRRFLVRLSKEDGAEQIDAWHPEFDTVAKALLHEAGVVPAPPIRKAKKPRTDEGPPGE